MGSIQNNFLEYTSHRPWRTKQVDEKIDELRDLDLMIKEFHPKQLHGIYEQQAMEEEASG